jgi:hypothetical protein
VDVRPELSSEFPSRLRRSDGGCSSQHCRRLRVWPVDARCGPARRRTMGRSGPGSGVAAPPSSLALIRSVDRGLVAVLKFDSQAVATLALMRRCSNKRRTVRRARSACAAVLRVASMPIPPVHQSARCPPGRHELASCHPTAAHDTRRTERWLGRRPPGQKGLACAGRQNEQDSLWDHAAQARVLRGVWVRLAR